MKANTISSFEKNAAGSSTAPSLRFAVILALVYFFVVLWCLFHHVMWRDEWHGWLASYHVSSFAELYSLRGHQNVPIGWPFLTWLVGRIGWFPEGPKVLQAFVAAGTVFLLARFSGLSRLQVLLAALGYFVFYEYGIFLRNYIYQTFLLLLACWSITSRPDKPLISGVVLAVLFLTTHAFGLLLGCMLGGLYLVAVYFGWFESTALPKTRNIVAGAVVALLALVATYVTMHVQTNEMWLAMGGSPNDTPLSSRLFTTVTYFFRAYFPIAFQGLWNTQIFDPWPWFQFACAIALFVALIPIFGSRPAALLLYIGGTIVFGLVIAHLALRSPFVAIRYHGQFFLIFLLSCWIFNYSRECARCSIVFARRPFASIIKHRSAVITAILAVQAVAGIMAVAHEQIIPISGSREAAEIIRQKAPEHLPVIGDLDYAMEPLSGYLERPIFVASRGEYTRYLKVDLKRRLTPMTPEALGNAVQAFMASEKSDVILVVNYPIGLQGQGVEQLGAVTRTMVSDEAYWIYRIKYAGL